jgi:uncharacterized protein
MNKYRVIDLFWLITIIMGGMLVGNLIGLFFLLPAIDFDFTKVEAVTTNPQLYPQIKIPMILMQGSTALLAFIVFPFLFSKFVAKNNFDIKLNFGHISVLLPVLITLFAIPLNGYLIEWNNAMQLPEFMSGFETWAKQKEDSLKELTLFLTNLTGYPQLILGLFVFAILPGIGEEYIFRGILQKYFSQWMNVHVAIWLAAIFFSAIHFQFYGFVPRMMLGALFGYLYWWSGNLLIPILAHATNNAFTLILMFLNNHNYIQIDLDSTDFIPTYLILISGIVFVFLLLGSYRLFVQRKYA